MRSMLLVLTVLPPPVAVPLYDVQMDVVSGGCNDASGACGRSVAVCAFTAAAGSP
jgi:hypothetical protein